MRVLLLALLVLAVPGTAWPVDAGPVPGNRNPAPPGQIEAIPVSLLVDLGSGQVLHERSPDLRFVPASMTKVMTAYVAFELIAQGDLLPEQHFFVSPETAAKWNGKGTSMYLRGGESVSVDMLLHGIATASANDASIVLAEGFAGDVRTWTGLMNAQARRLGMEDSHFNTPNGWPDGGKTYVSAADLVKLARALITRHPALYRRYFGQKRMEWHHVTLQSHDPTVGVVAGADGIKTGYTREAGYNFLGSAERRGRRLVMVIGGFLTFGLDRREQRIVVRRYDDDDLDGHESEPRDEDPVPDPVEDPVEDPVGDPTWDTGIAEDEHTQERVRRSTQD